MTGSGGLKGGEGGPVGSGGGSGAAFSVRVFTIAVTHAASPAAACEACVRTDGKRWP